MKWAASSILTYASLRLMPEGAHKIISNLPSSMDVPFISKSFYNYLEVSSSAFDKALTEKGSIWRPGFRFFCRLLGL